MQTHHFGNLKDTQGLTIRLPIEPPSVGIYKVFVTNSEGARKSQNIEITEVGQGFEIHNYNGKKKFSYGVNTFYIKQLIGTASQSVTYNNADKFSIYFQKPDAVDSDAVQTLIRQVEELQQQNIRLNDDLALLRLQVSQMQDGQVYKKIEYQDFTHFEENGIEKSTHVFIDTMIENTLKVIRNGSFLHQYTDFVYDHTTKTLTITPRIEDEYEVILYSFVPQTATITDDNGLGLTDEDGNFL